MPKERLPCRLRKASSSRLAQEVLAASVNGEIWDLTRPINQDAANQTFQVGRTRKVSMHSGTPALT